MKKPIILITLLLLAFTSSSHANNSNNKDVLVSLNNIERLTFLLLNKREGGEQAQRQYLEAMTTLTSPTDLKHLITMPIVKKLAGEHPAELFALYGWSNAEAANKLRTDAAYKNTLLPLQKQGWTELAYSDVEINSGESYRLSHDKFYTMSELWIKDEHKYQAYFHATQALRDELGAKILFKHSPTEYSSMQKGAAAPTYVLLIEWPNEKNIALYPESEKFKQAYPDLLASVEKFNWYQVALPTNLNY
ncbi:DUF1330 domain-containing protein [Thalassotalea marina]|uniref:DUF1330 domain-containing protein n=1 Tax=Thalassotalea marina TaxID=1673741 RepID=A0A919EKG8_9GAMM|nr:DUF1330 domain-containing protein [Thalassotalea marina]GHF90321.1 hypothetical protein GCM10017161_18010 [Thalassotalea marina]